MRLKYFPFVGILLFLCAGFLGVLGKSVPNEKNFFAYADVMIYLGLLIAWAISINYHTINTNIKKYLIISSALMIFWIVARTIKYNAFENTHIYSRYLWYAYYIPMIILPLMMFMAALHIGKNRPSKMWNILFVPAIILTLGILTNDFHQLAFKFKPYFADWNDDYTYGPLYVAVTIWILFLVVAALSVMLYKCKISKAKKKIWLPLFFICLYLLYTLCFYIDEKITTFVFNLPEMFCFACVTLWEVYIYIGLLPSNTNYGVFFNVSTINAFITDSNHSIKYFSKNAVIPTKSQIADDTDNIYIDENMKLCSNAITGGKVYWTEDFSAINTINNELSDVKEQIAELNVILQAETEMKQKRAKIIEQNKLYDGISKIVLPQLTILDGVIHEIETHPENLRKKYAKACVLNVYIKRISNLCIIGNDKDCLSFFELENSIREMLEYLEVYGVSCSFVRHVSGEFPTEILIFAFRFFEHIIEKTFENTTAVFVNLKADGNTMDLKLNLDTAVQTEISPTWAEEIKNNGGTVSLEREDDTLFVHLCFLTGGQK
ncbi:MAG: hypothetical protein ACI4M3_06790 [Acutalibacteraceae bacterium]